MAVVGMYAQLFMIFIIVLNIMCSNCSIVTVIFAGAQDLDVMLDQELTSGHVKMLNMLSSLLDPRYMPLTKHICLDVFIHVHLG